MHSRTAPKNLGQGALGIGSGLIGFHFDICFLATLDMLVRVTTKRWKDFSVLHKRERITPLSREQTKVAGRHRIVTLCCSASIRTHVMIQPVPALNTSLNSDLGGGWALNI